MSDSAENDALARLREFMDATLVCTRHGEALSPEECRECYVVGQIGVYEQSLREYVFPPEVTDGSR